MGDLLWAEFSELPGAFPQQSPTTSLGTTCREMGFHDGPDLKLALDPPTVAGARDEVNGG